MKRSVKILSVIFAAIMLAATLAACSVKDKTYTFESIEIHGVNTQTESEETYEKLFKRDVAFSSDGSYTVGGESKGYYKKKSNKIYVGIGGDIETSGDPQFTLSGGKLIFKKTLDDGVSVKVTFKKA